VTARGAVSRHRSREAALQVLYAADLAGRAAAAGDARGLATEAFENAAAHFELPPAGRAFARELVAGVSEHRAKLDELIGEHATHWRLDRMAAVDRNILRLAAYETVYTETPTAVVIDEAVDLANRFGGERSSGFVNGILDALARGVREGGA
jgi:N utilization substance protein B